MPALKKACRAPGRGGCGASRGSFELPLLVGQRVPRVHASCQFFVVVLDGGAAPFAFHIRPIRGWVKRKNGTAPRVRGSSFAGRSERFVGLRNRSESPPGSAARSRARRRPGPWAE